MMRCVSAAVQITPGSCLAGSRSSRCRPAALRPYPWQVCAERGEQTVAAGPVDEVHPPQVAGEGAAVDEAGQGQLPERLGVVVVLDHQRTGLARPFEQLYPRSADSTAPLG